ncbi:MAG TPA: nucleoside deaminase [Bryobacteraceae bacterium]|nr:nucleoside deaminase [Bryobacteraceae bacterium]
MTIDNHDVTREQSFILRAIEIAVENVRSGRGGPFGALIVKGDQIVAEGTNLVTSVADPTAHAEIVAIRRACQALGDWQLTGCDLFTSCEPCPMCLGAIYWARPAAVYYAATHEQAASAGFDDTFIYQQIRLSASERHIAMRHVSTAIANKPFETWLTFEGRVSY